jgi:psiF repeat
MRACRMRFSTLAAAVGLSLSAVPGGFAAAPPAQSADVPGAAAAPATHAAPPSGDAAAKHAKRTECLKDAKTKKLVGAEKTSFLKTCIAAP